MAKKILLLDVMVIFLLGLWMIFSTTSAEVLDHALDKSLYQSALKQLGYAAVGLGLCYGSWRLGYERLIAYSPFILLALTLLLVLVLIPGVGREVNGSKRWISIFGLSFQPSEFAKYFIPAYFISQTQRMDLSAISLRSFLILSGKCCIPLVLVLIEPNNGTTGVMFLTLITVFFLMQVPFRFWALPLLAALLVGGVFAYHSSYVSARLKVYINPELDVKGKGHQPYQAKLAAGSGGFWGRGPGNSLQKMSYLPEAQNDYIAAIYAEEWGYLGILSLILLYMLFLSLALTLAASASTHSGLVWGGAITFLITFQGFMNMGVVSGLLPSTGLNLPFFSQGGTSLMANMMGLGILLSLDSPSRMTNHE